MALFTLDGLFFILRWFHLFFGITWIGLLYYFNFVQGPFFAETDAPTKSNAIQKLVPRALLWFRWAAMVTFLTGWLIIIGKSHSMGAGFLTSSWGISILTGGIIGTFMWANVWFIIWPNQKIVIQSATQAASGGTALPNAAACGAKAGLASRHNVLFSIPMLFFMGAASHLGVPVSESSNIMGYFGVFALIMILLQFNAMKGKMGPLTSIMGVIHCGFALALALYFTMELMLK